jgi:hypothetical protein
MRQGWGKGGETLYARAMVTGMLMPLPAETASLGPKGEVRLHEPSRRPADQFIEERREVKHE